MGQEFQRIELKNFAHGNNEFYNTFIELLKRANNAGALKYILPKNILTLYEFSDQKRSGKTLGEFIYEKFIDGNQENCISFFNLMIPNIISRFNQPEHEIYDLNKWLYGILQGFIDLILSTNEHEIFTLDFVYDKNEKLFKRKLDSATITAINTNARSLESENIGRYEACVSEFLSFKNEVGNEKKSYYNKSLDTLKRIIENTLELYYTKNDGSFPKLHEINKITNIIFDKSNEAFNGLLNFVIKKVHHEAGGKPIEFTEKEYVYLWLQLNQILYLLNRYKNSTPTPSDRTHLAP